MGRLATGGGNAAVFPGQAWGCQLLRIGGGLMSNDRLHDAYKAFEDEVLERIGVAASEPKPWWASRGIWGGLIAAGAGVAGILGYSVSPADQVALLDLLSALGAALGGLIALVGRLQARRPIR